MDISLSVRTFLFFIRVISIGSRTEHFILKKRQIKVQVKKMAEILDILLNNPLLLAAILAVIWNIGGYVAQLLKIKKLEPYEVTKLAETLVLFEAVFLIMSTLVGIPITWTAIAAIAVMTIRSLKSAIDKNTAAK